MKIVVLNWRCQCIDVVPVSNDEFTKYGAENFNAELFLMEEKGFDLDDCHYMAVDGIYEDVPVFWNGEEEPYVVL